MNSKRNHQRGVAAIEFAFVVVLLILLTFGVTEIGRAFYEYNTLVKATRSAARYLSTQSAGAGWTEATNLAVCGKATGCGANEAVVPGLTSAMVSVCDASNCAATHSSVPFCPAPSAGCGAGNLVTVTIGAGGHPYHFVSHMSFVLPDINFAPISVTFRQA